MFNENLRETDIRHLTEYTEGEIIYLRLKHHTYVGEKEVTISCIHLDIIVKGSFSNLRTKNEFLFRFQK